ncbi:hypothetical protein BDA96_03G408400 [Sorghum bicolor]|uniref:Thioesterase domain-containing protein n=1 Tax=Sorghum bicolor TaxID=4558 RepID=A0A921UST3_SORBI|nr:hypothetical protein BDA96_03G408400 [Sorghum bicolor]
MQEQSKMPKLEDDRSKSKDGEGAAVMEWQLEPGVVSKLYDVFTVAGLRVDAIEPGRALCSFTVPPRLTLFPQLSAHSSFSTATVHSSFFKIYISTKQGLMRQLKWDKSKRMHGGALASLVDLVGSAVFYAGGSPTTGVSLEITISYINAARANEEIEIEGTALGIGEKTGCVVVEVRKKSTGEVIAHGRHTKYLALAISSKL